MSAGDERAVVVAAEVDASLVVVESELAFQLPVVELDRPEQAGEPRESAVSRSEMAAFSFVIAADGSLASSLGIPGAARSPLDHQQQAGGGLRVRTLHAPSRSKRACPQRPPAAAHNRASTRPSSQTMMAVRVRTGGVTDDCASVRDYSPSAGVVVNNA